MPDPSAPERGDQRHPVEANGSGPADHHDGRPHVGAGPADRSRRPGRPTGRERLAAAAVAVVVAAGVVLRFVTRSPLWMDEALSVNIAALPFGEITDALRRDGHPPLYYWLLHGWMRAVGDGDTAVRALSGLAGLATLPLAWIAGTRLGGRRVAVTAVLVMALSPYALRYSTETRMYALVVLLVMVGHLLVRSAVAAPRPRTLVGVAAVSAALLLTHYWAFHLLAATVAVLAAVAWRSPAWRRGAVATAVAAVAGVAAFLPWVPSFLAQLGSTGTPWAPPLRPTGVAVITFDDFGGVSFEGRVLGTVLVVGCLLALFARPHPTLPSVLELDLRTVPGVRPELAVAALTLLSGTVLGLVAASAFASRYAAVVFPLVLLAASVGLARLPGTPVRVGAIAVVLLLGSVGAYQNVTTARTQAGEVVEALNAQARAGDVVLYCPDQLGPAFSRHLKGGLTTVVYPTLDPPGLVDWRDYAERNAAAEPEAIAAEVLALTPSDATLWVVWSSTFRTFEQQCERVLTVVDDARPANAPVVIDDGSQFFEHAWLARFDP